MMKKLRIEFRYFNKKTCSRCKTTDKNVRRAVKELRKALRKSGVKVSFKTTRLPARKLAQSNSILINGIDVENVLAGNKGVRSSACRGCGALLKNPCDCRAYFYRGKKYGYVPVAMIHEAIRKTVEKVAGRE